MEMNFRQKQRQDQEALINASNSNKAERHFATPEDAIRQDLVQTNPPAQIAERLNESIAAEPKRGTSFWTKLGFRK
jgi:hypothetical protein